MIRLASLYLTVRACLKAWRGRRAPTNANVIYAGTITAPMIAAGAITTSSIQSGTLTWR